MWQYIYACPADIVWSEELGYWHNRPSPYHHREKPGVLSQSETQNSAWHRKLVFGSRECALGTHSLHSCRNCYPDHVNTPFVYYRYVNIRGQLVHFIYKITLSCHHTLATTFHLLFSVSNDFFSTILQIANRNYNSLIKKNIYLPLK